MCIKHSRKIPENLWFLVSRGGRKLNPSVKWVKRKFSLYFTFSKPVAKI